MKTMQDFEFYMFYYLRGKNGEPCVTVCLAKDGDFYFRGVSICSAKDMPCKEIGRDIAMQRVLRAYWVYHKKTIPACFMTDPINVGSDPFSKFLIRYYSANYAPFCLFLEGIIKFKTSAMMHCELTTFEQGLVARKLKKVTS